MITKSLDKRRPNRLKNYNYSGIGYYFITLCTKNKVEHFGIIKNGKVILNRYGKIVKRCWREIPAYYDEVEVNSFIVMPNHIHGIIIIRDNNNVNNVGTEHCSVPPKTERCSVTTHKRNYGLLSKVIKSFKNAATKAIHQKYRDYVFGWQRSFYDHIA